MALTPRQFNDRLHDVGEIHNMMQGEGKGRVRRDRQKHAELLRRYGKKIPEGWE